MKTVSYNERAPPSDYCADGSFAREPEEQSNYVSRRSGNDGQNASNKGTHDKADVKGIEVCVQEKLDGKYYHHPL